jgi:hypothetical protein
VNFEEESMRRISEVSKLYIVRIPLLRKIYYRLSATFHRHKPFNSTSFWIDRYRRGNNSGLGSYGKSAEFKAEVINAFVTTNKIRSVIEFGCGDGNQLALANYPQYQGYDVSDVAISTCRALFAHDPTKSFHLMNQYAGESAELVLSLDVVYHLVEDEIFESYMRQLFSAATRYTIVYATNYDGRTKGEGVHMRHRKFTDWIDKGMSEWTLIQHIPNPYPHAENLPPGATPDFYIYAMSQSIG